MKNILLLFCIFASVSCANTVDTVGDFILDGDYRISEIKGEKMVSKNIILSFNSVGNRVSGNTGCNEFSALYHQEGSYLEFSTPMNSRKFCEGKMETERKILSSFEKAARLERAGKEVVIYSADNNSLLTLTKID